MTSCDAHSRVVWTTEHILASLDGVTGCVTVAEIARRTGLDRKQVSNGCVKLLARELVERRRPGCYALTDVGRAAAAAGARVRSGPQGPLNCIHRKPKRATFRARVWESLRAMRKATIPELATMAAAGDEKDPENSVYQYLRALMRAGVVVKLPRREPGVAPTSPGFNRYLLARDLGPLAPTLKGGGVFDSNSRAMVEPRKLEATP